jgi:hypothetical protein
MNRVTLSESDGEEEEEEEEDSDDEVSGPAVSPPS